MPAGSFYVQGHLTHKKLAAVFICRYIKPPYGRRQYLILESFSCYREIGCTGFVIQSRVLTILLSHEVSVVQPLYKYVV